MRYIGDIHGRDDLYSRAIAGVEESVQVGDFGIGFIPDDALAAWPGGPGSGHRFIRGNHDKPEAARAHPQHIESGLHEGVFYVGGGYSIDAEWRIPGVSWWEDEEHSYGDLLGLIDAYTAAKPEIVVSHEGPETICRQFFEPRYPPGPSRTSVALQNMLRLHRPTIWVFGHWHQRRDEIYNGTRFICLEEGGWVDV